MTEAKKKTEAEVKDSSKKEEVVKLKGKYIQAVGKRKTSTARLRFYKNGTGVIIVNNEKASTYFTTDLLAMMVQPLKVAGNVKEVDMSVVVSGGGKSGQAQAVRHAITKALIEVNKELRPALKAKGYVTRDSRKKERKKPGLRRARRAPQWSKR